MRLLLLRKPVSNIKQKAIQKYKKGKKKRKKETEKHFFLVMRTQDPPDSWPPEPPGKLTWRAAVLA